MEENVYSYSSKRGEIIDRGKEREKNIVELRYSDRDPTTTHQEREGEKKSCRNYGILLVSDHYTSRITHRRRQNTYLFMS